ncbi:putative ribosomal protein S17e [Helianthus anomalus]
MTAIKTDLIEVDKETIDMLVALGMGDLPGVVKATVEPQALCNTRSYKSRFNVYFALITM